MHHVASRATGWLTLALLGASVAAAAPQQSTHAPPGPMAGPGAALMRSQHISFESLAPGTIVTEVFSKMGVGPVMLSAVNPALPGANAGVIFDSANPTGGDFDLGTPNEDFGGPGIGAGGSAGSPFENRVSRNNVFIVAENLVDANGDGLVDDPDDAENGGTNVRFDFLAVGPVDLEAMTFIDVEPVQQDATVELFDALGASLGMFVIPMPGDNGVATLDFPLIERVQSIHVMLDGSGAIDDIRFAPLRVGRIGDFVWCDLDNDGVADPGEPGLANVRIDLRCAGPDGLLDTPDDLLDSTLTGQDGRYQFIALPPGVCRITVDVTTAPPGKIPGMCPLVHEIDLIPFGIYRKADFCFVDEPGEVGDFVWCDTNDDGVQDPGEPGVPNVGVVLTCAGPDGILGTPDDIVRNTTTGPNGMYLFTNVDPDSCFAALDPTTIPLDKLPGTNCPPQVPFVLAAGQSFLEADFCLILRPAAIGDFVWCDTNDDGVQDPGEPGLPGVELTLRCAGPDMLLDTPDDVVRTQSTGPNGMYLFTGVPPGTCRVTVDPTTAPAGKIPGSNCPASVTTLLSPGETFLEADFCFINSGEVGDFVWCDDNNDGVQDPGEPGIPDVRVDLRCAGPDGLLGTADDILDSQTTQPDGSYLFTNLPAGLCEVTVDATTAPAGKIPGVCPTRVAFSLPAGGSFLDADFCFIVPGQIGDFVWCDENDDGVQDPGEPGIPDVGVELRCAGPDGLFQTADDVVETTTTGPNGMYLFTNVLPDMCLVTVDVTTVPIDKEPGVCPLVVPVTLGPGQSFLEADFCFRSRRAALGDFVWCDLDNDGMQDPGEPGLPDVRVDLRCAGLDGILGTADDLIDFRTTNAIGLYIFSDLPPGLCEATVDISTAPSGKVPGICPQVVQRVLDPGETFLDADFCFVDAPLGSIGDFVWCDLNDDGVQDPGEPGVPGVRVDLRCAGPDGILGTPDDIVDSELTGPSGMYLFEDLPAGPCIVSIDPTTAPPGKIPGSNCPLTLPVMLAQGANYLDADFCLIDAPARLGDFVWCDLDNDGVQDPGEPGIQGARVDLRCAGPDGVLGTFDDLLDDALTGPGGMYIFEGLPAGPCEVSVDPTTVIDKFPGLCPLVVNVTLQPGDSFLEADFCFVDPGRIGDFVWCDVDNDGVQDPMEPGVPDITVNLLCAGPDQILGTPDDIGDQQVTGPNGEYLFTGLPPGPCEVTLVETSITGNKEVGVCPPQLIVPLGAGETFLDADFCIRFKTGQDCCANGDVVGITFLYTGEGCGASMTTQDPGKWSCAGDPGFAAQVFVRASNDEDPFETNTDIWFEGVIDLNGTFEMDSGTSGFSSRSFVHVFDPTGTMLLQSVEFHTSCSQPLETGQQYGSLRIVDCRGENDPVEGDCCANGKPRSLTFVYTGDSCAATSHTQDPGKVNCSGDPAQAPTVFIRSSKDEDPFETNTDIWFEGLVDLGMEFVVDAVNAGEDKLSSATFIHIFDANGGNLLQTVEFHTSCSQPLFVGNQFGASLLIDCTGENEPIPGDCCANGNPRVLTFTYTGRDCSATSHAQDPGKVSCMGDPAFAQDVFIRSSKDEDPYETNTDIWFEGVVGLGTDFNVDATNAGENKLSSATFIHIFDATGSNLLQTVEFHTSCSQPLFVGNEFGASLLIDCIGENEPTSGGGPQNCSAGDPRILSFMYTGEDCSATSTTQDPGKWSCAGDPAFATPVYVLSSDDDDPSNQGARVWFKGPVVLGEVFDVDAGTAGENKLQNATFIHVFDGPGGTLLQTVEFHTSCSQPLNLGDQWGAFALVGFTPE